MPQGKFWNSWRDDVILQRTKRHAMRLCILRLQQGTIGRLFRAWHDESQQRAALRATAHRCMERLQHLLLGRAFTTWAAFPAKLQEAR